MSITDQEVAKIAQGLTKAQREAFMTLPVPCDPDPVRWQAGRTFSSLWRKSSKHWDAMLDLENEGLVERRLSRGETLWRPTKVPGLRVRDYLTSMGEDR